MVIGQKVLGDLIHIVKNDELKILRDSGDIYGWDEQRYYKFTEIIYEFVNKEDDQELVAELNKILKRDGFKIKEDTHFFATPRKTAKLSPST